MKLDAREFSRTSECGPGDPLTGATTRATRLATHDRWAVDGNKR